MPADLDLRRLARSLAPREPTETAVLAIRAGKGAGSARRGEPAISMSTSSRLRGARGRFGDLHSASEEITQYAADVVVPSPPSCGSWSSAA